MEDFAYVKKYKPIFNFLFELLYALILSAIVFFIYLLGDFIMNEDLGETINIIFLSVDLVIAGTVFFVFMSIAVNGLIRKTKFNKNNPVKCAIKLDTINEKLYLTNKKTEIFLKDIVDFDYIKVSEREFFAVHSSLFNEKVIKKSINKSRIGNLRIKLKNGKIVVVERVFNIENISEKLKALLNK